MCIQGRRQKNFRGRGQRKKQVRKIAPLSLPLLYQYHYENPGWEGVQPPLPTPMCVLAILFILKLIERSLQFVLKILPLYQELNLLKNTKYI